MVTVDRTLLEAALYGYERQREELEAKIAEIRKQIGNARGVAPAAEPRMKRTMNPAARERIAAAQKKRWAAYKKAHGTTGKSAAPKKRILSAAARKHIADATRKRWIEYRAAKAAGQKAAAHKAKASAKPKVKKPVVAAAAETTA